VVARAGRLTAALVGLVLGACRPVSPADLGRAALARGDDAGAARQLERALQDAPDDASLWRDLARAYQRRGDIERAHDAIVEAAMRRPEDPSIVLVRAQLRVARSDRDGAARDAKWLLGRLRDPGSYERLAVVFVRLGDAPRAIEAAREALVLADGSADAHVNLAVIAAQVRRFDVAAKTLADGRRRYPGHVELAQTQAALALAAGDLDGARRIYLELLARHPTPGLVHLALALIEHERGALDAAVGHARAAVDALGEDRVDVHHTLCVVLVDLGRLDEAEGQLARARRRFGHTEELASIARRIAEARATTPPAATPSP
jgi:tetratricopeptide (TPR) repeat protein